MSFCDRCRFGLLFERANGHETYLCTLMIRGREMPSDVVRCSGFDDRNQPELFDLKELGWRLEKDKNGKVKGFQPPREDA